MHPKLKIMIFLAVVLSIGTFLFAQTSFFKGAVQDAAGRHIIILSVIVIVLGLGRGIFLITNKEIKKEENRWIRIKVLINPFLIVMLTLVLVLSSLYLHLSFDAEFAVVTIIMLCILISGLISVIWLIKWMKNKNKTTSNYPHGGA
jgi:uncharacterized membrane protein